MRATFGRKVRLFPINPYSSPNCSLRDLQAGFQTSLVGRENIRMNDWRIRVHVHKHYPAWRQQSGSVCWRNTADWI